MPDARIGHGTTFEVFFGSDYVKLGEVTSITLPSLKRDAIDVSGIGTRYREYIKGTPDSGEITVEMNFIPGSVTEAVIRALFDEGDPGDLVPFRITVPSAGSPDTEQLTGNAVVTGYSPTVPLADKMGATLTFKVSGRVTYTSGL